MDPMLQGRSIPQFESTTNGFKPEELEYGVSDSFPVGHGIPSVVENTPEAMDDNSDSSAQSILKYFDSDSSFWRALTPSLVLDLDSPSYSVMDQIPHESSNHSCHTISSDSELYELEYNMSDGLPLTHGAPPVEENTTEAMDAMPHESSIISCYTISSDSEESSEFEHDMSDSLPIDNGTSSVKENTPEATDKKSIFLPQNISDDFGPDSSFWSAPTPPWLFPIEDGISPIHTTTKSDCEKDTKPLHSMNPQTPNDEGLTMFRITFEIITENAYLWAVTRPFYEYKSVYFFSLPKKLLTETFHQTLKFKAHETVQNFRMQQKLVCRNRVIDQWIFEKGFVPSQNITVWETFMKRSPRSDFFIDPTISSRLVLETKLYDGERLLREYEMHIVLT